jgi:hypothetical protein
MSQRKLLGVALIVGLALVAAGWHGFAAEEKADPAPRGANSKARRDAARNVYDASWKRLFDPAGEFAPGVEYFHDWSVRWLQAERDLSGAKADQVTAIESHLKRMQAWRDLIARNVKDGLAGKYEASAGEFFVLEAEDWLAAARAEQK